ncbi:MAG: hypothetical protein AVDCRST_MAG25-1760 [uncultured Rubrobacteraceae bacterium]|uniref:Uncharacterized protein n=1 Tax=uncultured Rubrobacteraceae bacterium TaxID=349277 RepID=A0A6J4RG98_9ACTN|nr:MAG: hypothetical protein AVDCRST_MAG25-1760 [uncultured Rubrobacteraceae bacterium]
MPRTERVRGSGSDRVFFEVEGQVSNGGEGLGLALARG